MTHSAFDIFRKECRIVFKNEVSVNKLEIGSGGVYLFRKHTNIKT